MSQPSTLPLAGVRVLDLTRFAAGPWATSLLADLGADVIKIEHPVTGDGARHFDDVFGHAMSSYFVGLNRSKRSVALALDRAEGQDVLTRLIDRCDVLVENFRPGWMNEHGLATETLHARNPRLVSCSLSSYGRRGPMAELPGMDIMAQAFGGVMGLTGERGREPCKAGVAVADFTGSFLILAAVLLGLYERERSGRGMHVDTSLLAGQLALLPNYVSGFAATGRPDGPFGSGHPQLVPYQAFRTADGYIVVGCLTEEHWRRLCRAMGREDLLADPRFTRNVDRVNHRSEIVAILESITLRQERAEWVRVLTDAGVPVGPVNTLADLLDSDQVRSNAMLGAIDSTHGDGDSVVVVANPLQVHGRPPAPPRPAPQLGEHTATVLTELGYTPREVDDLAGRGICALSPVAGRP